MKILSLLKNKLEIQKYKNQQRFINKHVKLLFDNADDSYTNTYNQLQTAQRTIANYAASKRVSAEISPLFLKGDASSELFLNCNVKNLKSGKGLDFSVNGDTSHIYTYNIPRIYHDPADGIEFGRGNIVEYEDTFLRHFYRRFAEMINYISH